MSAVITLIAFVSLIWPSLQFESLLAGKTIVDLSYTLNNETLHWIAFKPFEMKMLQKGIAKKGQFTFWNQAEEVKYASHTGTHIDAPCHFAREKWCMSDIPLRNFIDKPIAVIDVTQQAKDIRDYELSIEDITNWEKTNGKIPDEAVLLVRTGWSQFWGKKLEYFGTVVASTELTHFPGIDPQTAQWIVDNRNIVGVGLDAPSADNGQSKEFRSHQIFSEKNLYIIENVAKSIDQLPPTSARLMALPLKVEGASGTPATIIAYFDNITQSSSTITSSSYRIRAAFGSPLLLLLLLMHAFAVALSLMKKKCQIILF